MSKFAQPSGKAQKAGTVHTSRVWGSVIAIAFFLLLGASAFAQTPAVGAKAPDFTLSTPTGKAVTLSTEQSGHDLVLVILRGFPGYQCPYQIRKRPPAPGRRRGEGRCNRPCWVVPLIFLLGHGDRDMIGAQPREVAR